MRAIACATVSLALTVAVAPLALAAAPVGMVLDVAGPADPTLERFAELSDRESYRLGASTGLTFVHYRTCHVVSVVGGTLWLEQARYDVVGGRIESEQVRRCPQQHHVVAPTSASGQTAGALLLRSGSAAAPTLSARPELILAGARADAFTAVEIRRDNVVVALFPLTGRQLVWPRDRERLPSGDGYLLVLSLAGGPPVEIPFTVVEASRSAEADRLLIIRID
jgi:hypothetical protein